MSVDIRQMAAHLPAAEQEAIARQYQRGAKDATTAFLSGFFLGIFGVHRLYLGQWRSGMAHLLLLLVGGGALAAGFQAGIETRVLVAGAAIVLAIALLWEIADLVRLDAEVEARNQALANRLVGIAAISDTSVIAESLRQLERMRQETAAASAAPVAAAASAQPAAADEMVAEAPPTEVSSATAFAVTTTETQLSADPDPEREAAAEAAPAWQTAAMAVESQTDVTFGEPAAPEAALEETTTAVTWTHDERPHTVSERVEVEQVHTSEALVPEAAPEVGATVPVLTPDVPDSTDHHLRIEGVRPIADIAMASATPLYVALPYAHDAEEGELLLVSEDSASDTAPVAAAAEAPPAPQPPIWPVAESPAQPPVWPVAEPSAQSAAPEEGVAALGFGVAAAAFTQAHEPAQPVEQPAYVEPANAPTSETLAELADLAPASTQASAAPTEAVAAAAEAPKGQRMKRIRVVRHVMVDGEVVAEQVVEQLIPADADPEAAAAALRASLSPTSPEEIKALAHLGEDEELQLRTEGQQPE